MIPWRREDIDFLFIIHIILHNIEYTTHQENMTEKIPCYHVITAAKKTTFSRLLWVLPVKLLWLTLPNFPKWLPMPLFELSRKVAFLFLCDETSRLIVQVFHA